MSCEIYYLNMGKINSYENKIKDDDRLDNAHNTIQEILDDGNIKTSYKSKAIAYSVLVKKNVSLDDLETYLRNYKGQKDTDYNRLLVIYDYLKYGD